MNDCDLDVTIKFCELLLELGVIRPGRRYSFTRIRSISVLQWLLDHDNIVIQSYYALQ